MPLKSFHQVAMTSGIACIVAAGLGACGSKAAPSVKKIGDFCDETGQCQSGHCVDGVCCDTACDGVCQSCSQALSRGQCLPAKAGTDPRDVCRDDGRASCGHDGTCDGAGSCRLYLQGTLCDLGTCSEPTFGAKACDGLGSCVKDITVSCGNYRCGAAGSCVASCSSNTDCVAPSVCKDGACGGLLGEYFDAPDFTVSTLKRVDPEIDFSWDDGSPDPSIGGSFSVNWSGVITARFDETYTFYLLSDDGARLYIDGSLLINDWMPAHLAREPTADIDLHAGQNYPIQVQYWQKLGLSVIRLSWSSRSEPKSLVPPSALFPTAVPMAQ